MAILRFLHYVHQCFVLRYSYLQHAVLSDCCYLKYPQWFLNVSLYCLLQEWAFLSCHALYPLLYTENVFGRSCSAERHLDVVLCGSFVLMKKHSQSQWVMDLFAL